MEHLFSKRIWISFYFIQFSPMRKELIQNLEQKRRDITQKIYLWKEEFKDKYRERFPKPKLEKSTKHLSDNNQEDINTQSARTSKLMLKFWLIWLAVVVLWYMMYISLSYIYMVIAWFIISLALEWCIIFWQRLTKSRGIWILITYLLTTLFVLSGFIILIPFFFNRWTELLQSLTTGLMDLQTTLAQQWVPWYIENTSRIPWFLKEELIEWTQNSDSGSILTIITDNIWSIMNTSSDYLKSLAWQALIIFWNLFSIIVNFAIVLTLCIFFSFAHYDIKYALKYVFRHHTNVLPRIDSAYSGISARLKNQIFLCFFIWIMSYLWLRLLELFGISVPQKLTLAVLAWIFEIIPYVWPFLWWIPAAISALIFSGWWWFLAVIILYIIIQQSEEKILVPVLMWKTLWVSPLVVFICMILCGTIMWFFGVLLAVPIAVIVTLAFQLPETNEIKEKVKKSEPKELKTKKKTSMKK